MTNFLSFDGTQGYVLIPGYYGIGAPFDERKHRSITFWIRTTQSGTISTVCYWGASFSERVENGEQNRIRQVDDKLEIFGQGSGLKTASSINDGNWHHIAFVYNPASPYSKVRNFADADVYVDSVIDNGKIFDDGVNDVVTPDEEEVVIGARPASSGGVTEFFAGDLDEFAIYRDVISSGTITDSYNSGVRGANLSAGAQGQSLHVWYRMGDDPGDTVPTAVLYSGTLVDQSYHGRNGVTFSGTSIGV
jgi:hypothetical protein